MKSYSKIIILAATLFVASSCSKQEVVEPASPVTSIPNTDKKSLSEVFSFGLDAVSKNTATTTATISSVTGFESFVSSHGLYNSYNAIDNDALTKLTIKGTGFGTTKGTVTFGNAEYKVISIEWSDQQIIANVVSTLAAKAVLNCSITVNPISNSTTTRLSGSRTYNLVGTIKTRVLDECTHHASKRKLESGGKAQDRGKSYTQITGSINADYVPQAGDIWIFSGHQAFRLQRVLVRRRQTIIKLSMENQHLFQKQLHIA